MGKAQENEFFVRKVVKEVSRREYVKWEEQELKSYDENFCKTAEQFLSRKDGTDSHAGQIIKALLQGAQIFFAAGPGEPDPSKEINILNKVAKSYDRAFLLLYAPREHPITYTQHKEAMDLQYENFCRVYPNMDSDRTYKRMEQVDAYEGDMKRKIEEFLRTMTPHAKKLTIIFNGHGAPDGLCLSQEETNIPLKRVIEDVSRAFQDSKQPLQLGRDESVLYASAELVFAQCHGYCFEGAPAVAGTPVFLEHLSVIPLSDPQRPLVRFRVWFKRNERGEKVVVDAKNERLMEMAFAAREAQTAATNTTQPEARSENPGKYSKN